MPEDNAPSFNIGTGTVKVRADMTEFDRSREDASKSLDDLQDKAKLLFSADSIRMVGEELGKMATDFASKLKPIDDMLRSIKASMSDIRELNVRVTDPPKPTDPRDIAMQFAQQEQPNIGIERILTDINDKLQQISDHVLAGPIES